MKTSRCMFALPHELTGLGTLCGLVGEAPCNGHGRRCPGYQPHTRESRKALADAISEAKKQAKEKKA